MVFFTLLCTVLVLYTLYPHTNPYLHTHLHIHIHFAHFMIHYSTIYSFKLAYIETGRMEVYLSEVDVSLSQSVGFIVADPNSTSRTSLKRSNKTRIVWK